MAAYLWVLLVAASVTFVGTPLMRRLAGRIGAITPVRARDVHTTPIPRMGGVAMLLGFGAAMLVAAHTPFTDRIFAGEGGSPWGVLAGAAIVCAVGIADDLWELDAVTKLAGQAIAAGVMAWKGVQLVSIPLLGTTVLSSSTLLIVVSIFVVVLTINAVNFVDGLDGLAAGIVGIGGAAFFVYSYVLSRNATPDDYKSLASLITVALVGVCVGFLPHNMHPARVFMGDSGSMLIGLLLASSTLAITGQVDPMTVSRASAVPIFLPVVLPFAVLALPLADLLLAVFRRTRAGRMPWHPDKQHLHHRMLNLGHGHRSAVFVLYAWTAIIAFGVASTIFIGVRKAVLAILVAVALAALFTWGPVSRIGRRGRHSAAGEQTTSPAAAATLPAGLTDEGLEVVEVLEVPELSDGLVRGAAHVAPHDVVLGRRP